MLRSATLRYVALHCVVLHCVALRCAALRRAALRCAALHCVALRCVTLRCVMLHYITLHTDIPTYRHTFAPALGLAVPGLIPGVCTAFGYKKAVAKGVRHPPQDS